MILVADAPSVTDGLDQRTRRIVVGMCDNGRAASTPQAPSARVVQELSPGGRVQERRALYAAIVLLAQPFSIRYPLIESFGNFGSIDDDPAADPRWTECRLSAAGQAALDGFPNLLLNGVRGDVSCVPAHNAGEVCEALRAYLDDPQIPLERLLDIVQGPDLPGGGMVRGRARVLEAYATGTGTIDVEAAMELRESPAWRTPLPNPPVKDGLFGLLGADARAELVVTELPYGVHKGSRGPLLRSLRAIKREPGSPIRDVRDVSDRDGIALALELRGADHYDELRDRLLAETALHTSMTIDLTVNTDGADRRVGFRDLIVGHVAHRRSAIAARDAIDDSRAIDDRLRVELASIAATFGDARRSTVLS